MSTFPQGENFYGCGHFIPGWPVRFSVFRALRMCNKHARASRGRAFSAKRCDNENLPRIARSFSCEPLQVPIAGSSSMSNAGPFIVEADWLVANLETPGLSPGERIEQALTDRKLADRLYARSGYSLG